MHKVATFGCDGFVEDPTVSVEAVADADVAVEVVADVDADAAVYVVEVDAVVADVDDS